ncbi:hypothetical protein EV667_4130 [Ancylobacter aquaticus]|uniref:IS481 family transposase n=1 Tax=Ancylobacter aquaticus TaxID=100 RepID=A0A4R1HFS9_ANCAQ|nr:hypothetical protein EV667_4130 [Ancylobacter aquaticus]
MGQVLHGSATTTEAVRRAIQHRQESLRALAKRYGINQKTVAKWKKRTSVADLPTGPREPTSTVLSIEEEAIIIAFRRHTLLPLDDCLYALQATIPHLTRSSLHRCLQRHGVSRLPEVEGDKEPKRRFKSYGRQRVNTIPSRTAVVPDRLVHEDAVVVGIQAQQRKRHLGAESINDSDNERLFPDKRRRAFRPAGRDVGENKNMGK